ncbi:sphingomyelin phosphodiesterase 5 isoform X2 [Pundamilia nyererei]|uniref:sphingomyelin phosphodiesterase n=1 Tax=Pundamilia nyererei TaxID=303518 RepID=A0A3B4GCL6_9CICH|nr:PREDICTED: sphingomyelin phosphodiesterase 3-like isoform X2 [Pundamilia nyererei]
MALQASAFPNGFVAGIHAVGWAFIVPCFWFLDRLIAVCKSTTLEQSQRLEQECYLRPLEVFFGSITFFILFLATAPLAFLGFLLWAPLQACRRPFSYHREIPSLPEKATNKGFELTGKASFVFASANLCLLPDSLARFNNLANTQRRATAIGQCIVQGISRPNIRILVDSPSSCGTLSPSSSILPTVNSPTYGATDQSSQQNPRALSSQGLRQQSDVPWEISPLFPANVDILCLEEVFDKRAARKLTNILKLEFGHILYDIGVYACQPPCRCSSFKFFNSGLFLASRFPVLEAQYHCFPNSRGEDALAAKGLLSVKVLIGKNQKQKRVVGYFNCTHLHAPEGEGEIRCIQLEMVTKWIAEFQAANKQPDEDVVFDVLCGDFNFDNCSPDDRQEQSHSVFEEYKDPCRAGPGKEKPWVTGTLLEQPTLYEEDVNTPENLQRTLESEDLRKRFIAPPVPKAAFPLVYPETDQPWIGRRIDYILYRESSISKQCRTEIEEVTFITQLAGLTDHIPVGLKLNVVMDSDSADE